MPPPTLNYEEPENLEAARQELAQREDSSPTEESAQED